MTDNPKIIAVILARGGSKRLPNKNLLRINGKSLTQLAVECATKSGLRTVISSDSEEILNQKFVGDPILFRRSAATSHDNSSSEEGVIEVLEALNVDGEHEVVLLPPTSPTRTSLHVRRFLEEWQTNPIHVKSNQAISVVEMKQDIWMIEEDRPIRIRDEILGRTSSRRTQDRLPWYLETSAVYLSNVKVLRELHSFIAGTLSLIALDAITAIDIDNESDLNLARLVMEK